jgi:DNA-binding response OmpR family regulator
MVRILLIEDNDADIMLFREAIRASPISADVVIACDGEEAVRLMTGEGSKAHVIVLDLNLPKFDGFDILEFFCTQGGPPVVIFTSSTSERDRARALALGARDYVVKPFKSDTFIAAVQSILQRWTEAQAAAASSAE